MMRFKPLSLTVLLLAGCSPSLVVPESSGPPIGSRVTGSVTYRERIALPPTAVVTVRLVDVSRADAPSVLIAEQVIRCAIGFGDLVPARLEAERAGLLLEIGELAARHLMQVDFRGTAFQVALEGGILRPHRFPVDGNAPAALCNLSHAARRRWSA